MYKLIMGITMSGTSFDQSPRKVYIEQCFIITTGQYSTPLYIVENKAQYLVIEHRCHHTIKRKLIAS